MEEMTKMIERVLDKLNTDGIESLTMEDRIALITGDAHPSKAERAAVRDILQEVFDRR